MATIANTPTGLIRAFKQGRTAEQKERTEAGKAEGHIFLAPGDIQGEYARTRKLLTTLGGAGRRVITEDDLRQFKAASVKLGKRFGVGITAKDVIDKSLDSRRESAQAQIHYAVPMESRGSLFHFVTNSGPNSKHVRHNVLIDFMEFPSAIAQSPVRASSIGTNTWRTVSVCTGSVAAGRSGLTFAGEQPASRKRLTISSVGSSSFVTDHQRYGHVRQDR